MKVWMAVAIAVAVLVRADAASAQAQPPQDRINTALARARQMGIPLALLESKIAEGKAKGVSPERIAAALERREATLEKAHDALRGHPDADDSLAVGADAIESGVSEAVLKAIADNAPRDRRNVAIAALTELVQQGHVPEAALARVREALKREPDALANLPAEAGAGRGRGGEGRGGGASAGGNGHGGGGEAGPPSGVPGPGNPPQAGKPGGPPPGRQGGPGRGGR